MRAHPELIGGAGGPDVRLMQLREGWVAKGGAEGLFCAAGPGGLGVALKTEDGAYRPLGPAPSRPSWRGSGSRFRSSARSRS